MDTVATDTNKNVELSPAEETLNELLLQLLRVVLHHPQRHIFDDDPSALYWALQEYFALASARQKRVAQFCLSRGEVEVLLQVCLTQLEETALLGHLRVQDRTDSDTNATRRVEEFISQAPLVTLEKLQEHLRALARPRPEAVGPLLGSGIAEVVELCRLLDQRLGLPQAPLGAIHTIHFSAIVATLYPVRNLGELLLFVAEVVESKYIKATPPVRPKEAGLAHHFVAAIYYEWGILDPRHLEGLHALSQRCLDAAPGLVPPHPEGPSVVDLLHTPASVEEKKLMASAADPIMASGHFAEPQREDRRNLSDVLYVEAPKKTSGSTLQVMDTVVMPTSRAPSTSRDEEPAADGIDYQFWMDLAS